MERQPQKMNPAEVIEYLEIIAGTDLGLISNCYEVVNRAVVFIRQHPYQSIPESNRLQAMLQEQLGITEEDSMELMMLNRVFEYFDYLLIVEQAIPDEVLSSFISFMLHHSRDAQVAGYIFQEVLNEVQKQEKKKPSSATRIQ